VTVTPLITIVIYAAIFEWRRMCTTLVTIWLNHVVVMDAIQPGCLAFFSWTVHSTRLVVTAHSIYHHFKLLAHPPPASPRQAACISHVAIKLGKITSVYMSLL
jgi:hypothetical protein